MKIQRLEIENFRGIREMKIDFHPQLNVFAGMNGVGKTTILDALGKNLAIARLNHVTGNERQDLESNAIIYPDYIQLDTQQADIKLQLIFKNKTVSTCSSSNPEKIASDLFDYFPEADTYLPYKKIAENRNVMAATRLPEKNQWGKSIPANDTTKNNHYFNWISEREALEQAPDSLSVKWT
ncbi:Chromosome segregation protein SMC [Candidatus Electrothrix laxa]